MSTATYQKHPCPIAQALVELGDQWTLLIVRDALFRGCSRFGGFRESLGISRNLLTLRLNQLCKSGILERQSPPGSSRAAYVPTDKCRDLSVVILAMADWAEKWRDYPGIVHLETQEKATGQPVAVGFVRKSDGALVGPGAIRVENKGRAGARAPGI